MNDELRELVLKAKNGNKTALHQLIRLEENNIYTTLYYLKKDDNELSDIMQNILIKMSSKINTLKNPEMFKTWLNRIILNSYYDYMRKIKRKSLFFKDEELSNNIEDSSSGPMKGILDKELDNLIKKSIQSLPNHYKIPIALREIQGLSYEDISSITKTTIGTVKSRIARARGIIKNEINKYQKN